jgi:hypothetical protein
VAPGAGQRVSAGLQAHAARAGRCRRGLGQSGAWPDPFPQERDMIRKLSTGEYRLYSRKTDPRTGKRRNLGTFDTREAAEQHEREVQFFKRRG